MNRSSENLRDLSPLVLKRRIEKLRRTISDLQADLPRAKERDYEAHVLAERSWAEDRALLITLRREIISLREEMEREAPSTSVPGMLSGLFLDWVLQRDRSGLRAKVIKCEALCDRAGRLANRLGMSGGDPIPEPEANPYCNRPPRTWNFDLVRGRLEGANEQLGRLLKALGGDTARLERLEAVEARVLQKERDLAAKLRLTFRPTDECPYCERTLGNDSRLDHIYPVSKGGLSVSTNLVFVCLQCNQQKSDMTLAAFLRAYSLNRPAVEARLTDLGKEF